MKDLKKKIREHMWMEVEEYLDECGEVDCTQLAEDTASSFDIYEDDINYVIPEWVYDMASEAASEFEG